MNVDGYETKTTFWQDFSIAEAIGGVNAVLDTYHRAFTEWRNNVVYVTELSLVLNWKIWQWYQKNEALAEAYDGLWRECDNWCRDNLTGDDAVYYYRTTD